MSGVQVPPSLPYLLHKINLNYSSKKTSSIFEKAIKIKSDDIIAIGSYANALVKLNRIEKSLPWFEKALEIQPDNVRRISKYASVLAKIDRAEDSLPLFEKALQQEPDNAKTIASYASALVKLERVEESLSWWEKSLRLEPDNVLTITNRASALVKLERVEESLPLFERSLQLEPDNVKTLTSYASALTKIERVEESLPWFDKALKLQPNNANTIATYAHTLNKAGKFEESLPWFEKALELQPDNIKLRTNYGTALMKLGRHEEYLYQSEKVIKLETDNAVTIGSHANALIKAGKIEDSLPLFEKALQIEPNDVTNLTSYANALITAGEIEKSLVLFEKALLLASNNVLTITNYASALIKLDRLEESLPYFQQSLQLETDNILTITNYASALIKLERVEDSLPLFEKALQLEPDNVKTLTNYASALMKLGKFDESCHYLKKSLKLKDDNYLRYKYATALEELGQYRQAIEQLKKINLTDLLPYHANVIRLTLGRLYYSIQEPKKGDRYFQQAIDNSDDREASLLYGARSILANNPYHKKAIEMLDEIARDSPRYANALQMLNLNLDSEEYYERIDSETNLKDTQMLNRAMYHKISNEIAILKSIAYYILRFYRDEDSTVNQIIEKVENLVEEISQRREIQEDKISKIPEDNYGEILSVISKTAHDISDFVNNELAVIELETRWAMRTIDSESKNYSQFEELLTQLELTQAALNDLKAINEGINIKYKHFPVKKIFEKWQDNNKIENAEIQLEIVNGDSDFYGDEEKIKSFLNEMVKNSLKHNSYQQNLIIKMKSQDIINPPGIRGLTMPGEQKYLLIEFSDNGKGIPADKKQWIFQPLTTTSKKGQGSGLGLYIIRRTLIKMQGHIRETGENGVRFEMYIPYGDN